MKKVLFLTIAAALALVSCSKQQNVPSAQPGDVRFTTNIQTYTVKASDTAFDNGDLVGIFAPTLNAVNVKATVSGEALVPSPAIKWKDGDNSVVNFYAYYPYAANTAQTFDFSVKADQSGTGYTQSDLMLASKSTAPVDAAVELKFSHKLSKVVFKITNTIENTTVSAVAFEGVYLTTNVNVATGALTDVNQTAATIKAATDGNDYKLILVPQTSAPKVRVSLSNGKDYVFSLADEFQFKSGKKATANLTVKPEAETSQVEFSLDVNDWDADTDELGFGDPSVEDAEEPWVVTGKINGKTWEDPAVVTMTKNEYGDYEADITWAEDGEFKLRKGDLWVGMKPGWESYALGDFGNDTNYLADGDEAQNIRLAAPVGEYHLYFDPENYWFVVSSVDTDPSADPETVKFTVNVYNSTDWEALYIHSWTDNGDVTTWPGITPNAADVVVSGNTFKSFELNVPKGVGIGYMFDDNNGKQTADCSHAAIDADLTLYVWLLPDAGVQVIDNPATFDPSDVPATVWAIVGLQNDWTNGIAMTPVANDENSVEAQFNYDSLEANFKFKVYGAAWNNNYYGPADGNDLNYDLTAEYVTLALGANGNIFLPAVGNYKATLTIAGDNAGRLKIVAVQ